MSVGVPHTFVDGECLTADQLNNNFEYLCAQLDLQPEVFDELTNLITSITTTISALELELSSSQSMIDMLKDRVTALEEA